MSFMGWTTYWQMLQNLTWDQNEGHASKKWVVSDPWVLSKYQCNNVVVTTTWRCWRALRLMWSLRKIVSTSVCGQIFVTLPTSTEWPRKNVVMTTEYSWNVTMLTGVAAGVIVIRWPLVLILWACIFHIYFIGLVACQIWNISPCKSNTCTGRHYYKWVILNDPLAISGACNCDTLNHQHACDRF